MVQGRGINASLNETGQKQAEKAFDSLKNIPFDHIYTSELIRTKETVKHFLEQGIPHASHEGFDEISWGNQEGVKATLEEKNMYAHTVDQWSKGNLKLNVGGGETPIEVMDRQKIAMRNVIESNHETILICMHGRAMRVLLCWLLNYPLNYMDGFPHQNCAFYKLNYTSERFAINQFNVANHMA